MCSALKYWWVGKNIPCPVILRNTEADGSHKEEGWCRLPSFFLRAVAICFLRNFKTGTVKVIRSAVKYKPWINKGLINKSSIHLSSCLSIGLSVCALQAHNICILISSNDLSTLFIALFHQILWIYLACKLKKKITIKFSQLWRNTFPQHLFASKGTFLYFNPLRLFNWLFVLFKFYLTPFFLVPSSTRVEEECLVSVAFGATLMLSLSGLSVCSLIDPWLRH